MLESRRNRPRDYATDGINLGFGQKYEHTQDLNTPRIQVLTPSSNKYGLAPDERKYCPSCKRLLEVHDTKSDTYLCIHEHMIIDLNKGQTPITNKGTEMKVPAGLSKDPYEADKEEPVFISVNRNPLTQQQDSNMEIVSSSPDGRFKRIHLKNGVHHSIHEEPKEEDYFNGRY